MRGGAYNTASFTVGTTTSAPGLQCDASIPAPATAVRLPSVGFRCCLTGPAASMKRMPAMNKSTEGWCCEHCRRRARRGRRARAGAAAEHHDPARYLGLDALQPGERRLAALPNNHTTNGQTSRVYNMKNAIRAALAQVGTDEANFGLVRFPQLENAADDQLPGRALEQRHDRELRHQHDLHRRRRQPAAR